MQFMSHRKSGFTLVEIAILMPMIILMIGAMVGVILFLANSSMRSQAKSKVQMEVLSSLSRMEQDVRNSVVIDSTSVSSSTELVLSALATDKDPINTSRKLIKASDCSIATTGLSPNEALRYQIKYRKVGSTLVRETSFSSGCGATSSNVWQRTGTETLINSAGAEITLGITYPVIAGQKSATSITLTEKRTTAGEPFSFTGYMYARSINDR